MSKIGFVILHYISLKDTVECVQSIQARLIDSEYYIIVVDNASPNRSGEQLKKIFECTDNIEVIINHTNAGFSKGNNIGIKEARKRGTDFVVVINNDICFIQDGLREYILEEYKKSGFAVLGPKILTADGREDSNPIGRVTNYSLTVWKRGARIAIKNYLKSLLYLDIFQNRKSHEVNCRKQIDINQREENVALHGCCLIFSPKYFEKYSGFEELTFMYGEETILEMNCRKENLLMVYNPQYTIYHKEAIATNIEKSSRKKQLLYRKRMMKAVIAICKKIKKEFS